MTLPIAAPVDLSPIAADVDRDDLDPVWRSIVTESRARANDIHL
ncbi:MAG TPA: hydrolase, partial [Microbacterium sp.]|nr:hydrolase [Microbacterium sp.]